MSRLLPILLFLLVVVAIVGNSGGSVDPASIQRKVNGIAQSIDDYQPSHPPPDLTPQYNPFDTMLNGAPATPQLGRFQRPGMTQEDYAAVARAMQQDLRTTPANSELERTYGQWLSITSNIGCNGWVRNDLIREHTNPNLGAN